MTEKTPTPIIDRNGKATTVWKKTEPALTPAQRLAVIANGFGKSKGHPPLDDWLKKELFTTVQRLRPRKGGFFDDKTGFDFEFELEHMGTTSFEWNATKESLGRMRKDEMGLERLNEDFLYQGSRKTVYFVGTNLENKVQEFQQWLDEGAKSREHNNFGINFDGTANEIEKKTQAWWSLSGDIAWTFDEKIAERLVNGIAPY